MGSRTLTLLLISTCAMLLNALALLTICSKVAQPARQLLQRHRGLSLFASGSSKSGAADSAAPSEEEKKRLNKSRIASLINKTSTGTTYKTTTGRPSSPISRLASATKAAAADKEPSLTLRRVSRASAFAAVTAEAPARPPRAARASSDDKPNRARAAPAAAAADDEAPVKPRRVAKPAVAAQVEEEEEEEEEEESEGDDRRGEEEENEGQKSHITSSLFQDLEISANTKKAIASVLKYQNMSNVQEQAIPAVLGGSDVFVKARTGTGKTLAFLIPAIDVLIVERKRFELASRSYQRADGGRPPVKPLVVVLSPTRELALQIATEAQALCTFHSFQIVTLVGGVDIERDKRAMARKDGYDIVVATPGRIFDHLTSDGPSAQLAKAVRGTKVLVLDEADRMLDMGFRIAVQKICDFLPDPKERQTLLFSATFTDDIKAIAQKTLRPGYQVIDTVGDAQEQTHSHVPQKVVVSSVKSQIRDLFHILSEHKAKAGKVIVFFPTAKQTHYFATLFDKLGIRTLEIHSGKSQSYRSRVSDEFRQAKKGFLFTSDVTARGLDYPDVTLVVQFGMTDKQNYIHRLGRTARAGKNGQGILLCTPYEQATMMGELEGLPLVPTTLSGVVPGDIDVEGVDGKISLVQAQLGGEAEDAWAAWVGYYNSQLKKLRWSGTDFAARARDLAVQQLGLAAMPRLQQRTLQKMGLAKIPGFEASPNSARAPSRGRGGAGGGAGGRAGGQGGGGDKKKSFYESTRRSK